MCDCRAVTPTDSNTSRVSDVFALTSSDRRDSSHPSPVLRRLSSRFVVSYRNDAKVNIATMFPGRSCQWSMVHHLTGFARATGSGGELPEPSAGAPCYWRTHRNILTHSLFVEKLKNHLQVQAATLLVLTDLQH